jgi:hypothetical protein
MISVNVPSFDFYFGQKISRAISIMGIMDHLHENNPFLKLELRCMPKSTTCSTNSMVELLHDKIFGVELKKTRVEQSQTPPKYPLVHQYT